MNQPREAVKAQFDLERLLGRLMRCCRVMKPQKESPNAVQCIWHATSKSIAAVLLSDASQQFRPLSKIDRIEGYYAGMRGFKNLSGFALIVRTEMALFPNF